MDHWNPGVYKQNASFVPSMATDLISIVPKDAASILDIGCGDGVFTKLLISNNRFPNLKRLVATDSSPSMVDSARLLLSEFSQIDISTHVLDGQNLASASHILIDKFDVVVSNAALHWMSNDPRAVVSGVRAALRPGGVFVAEAGGFGNIATIHGALLAALERRGFNGTRRAGDGTPGLKRHSLSPWFFPTPEEYTEILEAENFKVLQIQLIPRPTPLPTGLRGWLVTFGGPFKEIVSNDAVWDQIVDEVVEETEPALCDYKGNWIADYVRLRFVAVLQH
ncbi:methyltransferase [Cladochytrium replicatum]|nr:methyltransferase [Cladochytrium replicatum]